MMVEYSLKEMDMMHSMHVHVGVYLKELCMKSHVF
jgi:hypothetical protein